MLVSCDQCQENFDTDDVVIEHRRAKRNCHVESTAVIAAGLIIIVLITTGLDRTLLRYHLAVNWPAWINQVESVANGWFYQALLIVVIVACLLARGRLMRMTLVAVPLQFVLLHALKITFGRVRPVDGGDPLLFSPLSTIHESYPSGHAAIWFTLAFIIAAQKPKLRIPGLAVALFYCWMRVQSAAHFGSDLLAGALLGYACAATARLLTDSAPSGPRNWFPAGAALASIIFSALIVLPWTRRPPVLSPEQADAKTAALYLQILDRDPDPPGWHAYSARLQNRVPVIGVAREMLGSDEFRRNLRKLDTPQARATDLYRRLLGRNPTPDELKRDAPLLSAVDRLDGRLDLFIMRITLGNEYRDAHN